MDFVTVATSYNPYDLYPLKISLENNGIQCFIKDEHTIQANPLLANAIGGVKLQVLEEDVQKAVELLKELGYEDKTEYKDQARFVNRFDKITAHIPILKRFSLLVRFFILLVLLAILLKFLLGL
jgi:hypothetical protein